MENIENYKDALRAVQNKEIEQRKTIKKLLQERKELKKQLKLYDVSQQRELLNALADDFNDSTDTYVGQTRIEKVLKAFNCG